MEEDYVKAQEELGLKDGMYVRTKDNGIDRFKYKKEDSSGCYYNCFFEKTNMSNPEYYVIGKPSFNLIDLIEVKDIVKVQNTIDKFIFKIEINDEKVLMDLKLSVGEDLTILSILTHEQYEENAYKVKEE